MTQKNFTEKINKLILKGKEQGFSTKDISDKWHTFGGSIFSDSKEHKKERCTFDAKS